LDRAKKRWGSAIWGEQQVIGAQGGKPAHAKKDESLRGCVTRGRRTGSPPRKGEKKEKEGRNFFTL